MDTSTDRILSLTYDFWDTEDRLTLTQLEKIDKPFYFGES
jgi:hypothetical protein